MFNKKQGEEKTKTKKQERGKNARKTKTETCKTQRKKDFYQILKHLEALTKSKITKKNKKNQDKQRKIKKK